MPVVTYIFRHVGLERPLLTFCSSHQSVLFSRVTNTLQLFPLADFPSSTSFPHSWHMYWGTKKINTCIPYIILRLQIATGKWHIFLGDRIQTFSSLYCVELIKLCRFSHSLYMNVYTEGPEVEFHTRQGFHPGGRTNQCVEHESTGYVISLPCIFVHRLKFSRVVWWFIGEDRKSKCLF